MDSRVRPAAGVAAAYVALYSFLPHKEASFLTFSFVRSTPHAPCYDAAGGSNCGGIRGTVLHPAAQGDAFLCSNELLRSALCVGATQQHEGSYVASHGCTRTCTWHRKHRMFQLWKSACCSTSTEALQASKSECPQPEQNLCELQKTPSEKLYHLNPVSVSRRRSGFCSRCCRSSTSQPRRRSRTPGSGLVGEGAPQPCGSWAAAPRRRPAWPSCFSRRRRRTTTTQVSR